MLFTDLKQLKPENDHKTHFHQLAVHSLAGIHAINVALSYFTLEMYITNIL